MPHSDQPGRVARLGVLAEKPELRTSAGAANRLDRSCVLDGVGLAVRERVERADNVLYRRRLVRCPDGPLDGDDPSTVDVVPDGHVDALRTMNPEGGFIEFKFGGIDPTTTTCLLAILT
jgi:hypothetical protein